MEAESTAALEPRIQEHATVNFTSYVGGEPHETPNISDIAGETNDNVSMGPGIRDRIRRLPFCDRLLLLLVAGWSIAGIPANYFRVRGAMGGGQQLAAITLWATIAGVIAYSLVRRERRLADYGFSFKIGGVASLAIIGAVHVYLAMSGKFVLSASESLVWVALGALMEEIAFRAIAIDRFIALMDGIKGKAFWEILASSVLFSIPHIPSKSPAELQGIFLSSLIVGYVYYASRSILLPAWIHGISNAGYPGGILIVAIYGLLGAADCAIRSRKRHTPLASAAWRN